MKMNLYTSTLTFTITLFLSVIPLVLCSRFCQWSNKTAVPVSSCPQNKSVMEERAKIKDCATIAVIQSCTVSGNFKYHCLMNELETGFVEVCAPQYYIHGYCTEYNSLGAAIQEHFSVKCSDVKPPCNNSYLSTDAYLYKGCYERFRENTFISSTEFPSDTGIQKTTVSHLRIDKSDRNTYLTIIALTVGLGTAIILSCLIIKFKTRIAKALACKRVKKGPYPTEEQFFSVTEENTHH